MITKLYGNYGFINSPLINLPSNIYMPKNLFEKVVSVNNLFVVGNNLDYINGGGVSFDKHEAEMSAFGEFVERYSSSFQVGSKLIFGSYQDLSKKYRCFNPSDIKYFSDKQYSSDNFKLKKLENDSPVHWIESKDYFSNENILLPFFMTNVENIMGDGKYHINTTTGTACHTTINKAIEGGLLECIERDGFAKFWYLQNTENYRKFSSDFILNQYPNDEKIDALFNNKKVKVVTFDISEFAFCPTFVTFIFFKRKNVIFQSMGSATRLNHKEALIKSCIEAYQGIEYTELVNSQNKSLIPPEEINQSNFSCIDSFHKHYALYNLFPELIEKVPVLKNAHSLNNYSQEWTDKYPHHLKNFTVSELKEKGLNEVYYTVLTTDDVKQLGLEVVKVVTPKLHLLTGNFNYPYLGLFDDKSNLMTSFPHPFP